MEFAVVAEDQRCGECGDGCLGCHLSTVCQESGNDLFENAWRQSKEWILGKFKASPILDAACKKVLSTYLFMRVWGMFHLLAKCWQGQADLTFIKLEISIPYCMDSMFSYPITISIL